MTMKSRLNVLLATAAMMSYGLDSYPPVTSKEEYAPSYQPPSKLGSYKHKGELPKGCKLETQTLSFDKEGHTLSIEVDIVYGSEKAKAKRINLYTKEIQYYISKVSLEQLMERGEFDIKLK